jgi:aspartyl-tRNA(Asn)/glutamyl-tRNA(Gln) amidotransferase subunit C
MALTLEDVRRLAQLARLRLDSAQCQAMLAELNGIFAMIEQMSAVDTEGIVPMSHPRDMVQRLRVDQVTEGDRSRELLALAPRTQAGLYLVPKVIE